VLSTANLAGNVSQSKLARVLLHRHDCSTVSAINSLANRTTPPVSLADRIVLPKNELFEITTGDLGVRT
jgi:hypothetical protein